METRTNRPNNPSDAAVPIALRDLDLDLTLNTKPENDTSAEPPSTECPAPPLELENLDQLPSSNIRDLIREALNGFSQGSKPPSTEAIRNFFPITPAEAEKLVSAIGPCQQTVDMQGISSANSLPPLLENPKNAFQASGCELLAKYLATHNVFIPNGLKVTNGPLLQGKGIDTYGLYGTTIHFGSFTPSIGRRPGFGFYDDGDTLTGIIALGSARNCVAEPRANLAVAQGISALFEQQNTPSLDYVMKRTQTVSKTPAGTVFEKFKSTEVDSAVFLLTPVDKKSNTYKLSLRLKGDMSIFIIKKGAHIVFDKFHLGNDVEYLDTQNDQTIALRTAIKSDDIVLICSDKLIDTGNTFQRLCRTLAALPSSNEDQLNSTLMKALPIKDAIGLVAFRVPKAS